MMKLLVLGLIFSLNAFASNCPDISGNFMCKEGSRVSLKEISLTSTGYNIISDGMSFDYITDGQFYDVASTENMKDAKIKSSCVKDKFIVDFNATILYDGSVLAKQVSKSEYSLSEDKLVFIHKTKMKGLPLPTIKYLCERI